MEKAGWSDCGYYKRREYATYDDYLVHQKSKLKDNVFTGEQEWLDAYEKALEFSLTNMTKKLKITGNTVLCLGARRGAEVRAFLNAGNVAIGIDIYPGPDNAYVLYGDFHKIQFPDSVFDIVFMNCMDHAYNIADLLSEIWRVTKRGGLFMWYDSSSMAEPGPFESASFLNMEIFDKQASAIGWQHKRDISPHDNIHTICRTYRAVGLI